jgi:GTPase SAR1 family protein
MTVRFAPKTSKKAIDDFFKYTKKGHKRVASLSSFLFFFLITQLLYAVFFVIAPFWAYFIISVGISYVLALYSKKLKKHRHNGIQIGYEYPHPIGMETSAGVTLEGKVQPATVKISTSGSKGIYDLQTKSEPNPHVMIIGESGSGKTNLTLTFLTRSYSKFGIPFLIMDWSGSYKHSGIDVNTWRVPTNLKINPFPLRGMSIERRAGIASELLQVSLALTDLQAQKVRETLVEMYNEDKEPTIKTLHDRLLAEADKERYKEMKLQLRYITNKLRQAYEIFGYEAQEFWDNYDKTLNVVDMEGLTDIEKKLVTHTIMQRIIEEFKVQDKIKLYIALDDAYQAIVNYQNKETNITKVVREGRKYGFGLLISTQLLEDLPAPIIANTSVKFVMSYHEPVALQKIHNMLVFTEVEKALLHRMPVGSCFLFDQNAIQNGMPHPAYIEVDKIGTDEKNKLKEAIKRLDIKKAYDFAPDKIPDREMHAVIRQLDIPSVSVYRFLVAFDRTQNLTEAHNMLKSKKWITSISTLYGSRSRPSLQQRAIDGGYFAEGKLTKKAQELLDPYLMIQKQGMNKGSEEHTSLMRHTIVMIQNRGNYPFVLKEREAFDVGELKTDQKIKGMWDYYAVTAYEVQTNALQSEIYRCIEKAKAQQTELVFVTNSNKTREEIERLTNNQYKCLKLTVDEPKSVIA